MYIFRQILPVRPFTCAPFQSNHFLAILSISNTVFRTILGIAMLKVRRG